MKYQIAVDGLAGSGKTTICKIIAKDLNFTFISTGGFFRSFAYLIKKYNININDENLLINKFKEHKIEVKGNKFLINNENVSNKLISSDISSLASLIAPKPLIRNYYQELLKKEIQNHPRLILDGRGINEEIFPNPNLNIYFYCSLYQRSKRRYRELKIKNNKTLFLKIYFNLFKRDWKDKHRKIAPSKITANMIKINTTHCTINEVVDKIKQLIKE